MQARIRYRVSWLFKHGSGLSTTACLIMCTSSDYSSKYATVHSQSNPHHIYTTYSQKIHYNIVVSYVRIYARFSHRNICSLADIEWSNQGQRHCRGMCRAWENLKKNGVWWCGLDSSGSRNRSMVGSCDHGNEPSHSTALFMCVLFSSVCVLFNSPFI